MRSDPPGGEGIHDLLEGGLVLLILLPGGRGRIQVFFKPGLEDAVVINVPALAVPGDDLTAGVEEWDVFAQKGTAGIAAASIAASAGRAASAATIGRRGSGSRLATSSRSCVRDLGENGTCRCQESYQGEFHAVRPFLGFSCAIYPYHRLLAKN